MKIKVGDYDVLDSGSIVGNLNEPIDFFVETKIFKILRLIFVNDSEIKENKIRAETDENDKNILQLRFTNFNNSLGIGNVSPIRLGEKDNRNLLFNYRIYSIDNGGKHIHYTWLLGEEVKNG